MKEKEFNLSEHNIEFLEKDKAIINNIYSESDVKEFIKWIEFYGHTNKIKDMLIIRYSKFKELAGEKLIEEKTK